MYELIQAGQKTYYIECPSKIGIYQINDKDICLIDSGSDKDVAKKVLKIIQEKEWHLEMIINTHSHADHIGGNAFLSERTQCQIYTVGVEQAFTTFPFMEPSFLFGGYPPKALHNKFLCAKPSPAKELHEENLPSGLSTIKLDGHSFSMIGVKTSDDVIFLADSLISQEILEKYHIAFVYDVKSYRESLEVLQSTKAKIFIPSHGMALESIDELIEINRKKSEELETLLVETCAHGIIFEDILQNIFNHYSLEMNFNQYVLVGSSVRSYLSYLCEENAMQYYFENNKLLWKTSRACF